MKKTINIPERRTSADDVFDFLRAQIVTMQMRPGDKISEADIAARFGISRQPVRDAFSRLSSQHLLLVRPQRATTVRRFSLDAIALARFVRLAVELEVAGKALSRCTPSDLAFFETNIEQQRSAAESGDHNTFHKLDYEFHRLIAHVADAEDAFTVVAENKAQIDRLCTLSLTDQDTMFTLIKDHQDIVAALKSRDQDALRKSLRLHLSRLDDTIEVIHEQHPDYFE